MRENKVHYKNYLWLLLIALLAYWPLTFNIYSVKNDAIHYFLPYRFHISEAIRNGLPPFWSPFIYLGYPIYGDMQSGAWNPVVWIFSLISRYDVTLFHYENIFYIFLGAIGMYKLSRRLVDDTKTAFLVACSYMLSGFMLSGQLINWLAAAAFLPFVIHYYTLALRSGKLGHGIKTGIALYLLFTAGYPSFFIITIYILFFLFAFSIVNRIRNKRENDLSWTRWSLQQGVMILIFAGLSLPAIVSYIELLPYYQRGAGTSYAESLINSFDWRHLSSLFFPSSIKGIDLTSSTDITFRNVYFGLFAVLALLCFPPRLNQRNILLMALAVFALLFSLGDLTPVRKICYDILPLMDSFRHPSMMRLFFIFAILLLAAPGIQQFINQNAEEKQRSKKITLIFGGVMVIVLAIAATQANLFSSGNSVRSGGIKNLLDNLSFADSVFFNAIMQLIFLATLWVLLRRSQSFKNTFIVLWVANLFLFAQFILPISFVSSISPKEINQFIHASPKGFSGIKLDKSLAENSVGNLDHFDKIALSSFYNKKIGVTKVSNTPAFLDEQEIFLNSEKLYAYIASKPLVYQADSLLSMADTALLSQTGKCNYAILEKPIFHNDSCSQEGDTYVQMIAPNYISMATHSPGRKLLVISQSFHHYWQATLDGKSVPIYKTNTGFMGIQLEEGYHRVTFWFVPRNTILALTVFILTILALTVISIYSFIKRRRAKA